MTPVPFWLRIASMAMAVLPVLRSPMISSRWPRPIGVMASIDLMPVWSGSSTGWRSAIPGAGDSSGQVLSVAIGPCSSIGSPSAVDHAADHRLADRHAEQPAGRRDRVAFLDPGVFAQDHHADRRLLEVQRDALDAVLERHHLAGHEPGEAVDARDAVADLEDLAHLAPRDLGGELLDLTLDN